MASAYSLEHLPDDLLTQTFAGNSIGAIHGQEDLPTFNASRGRPGIDRHLNPGRHRRCSDATVLSLEIDNAPPAVALLDVRERQRRHFRST